MMAVGTLKRYSHSFVPATENPRLTIVEHFDAVHGHIDLLLRSSKGLLNVVKKRISLEKERIKSLSKLSLSIIEDSKTISFEGVLLESWRHIQQHCQQETLHRSKVLTSLEEKVVQPLSVFLLSDLEKRFQNLTNDVRQRVKDYQQYRTQVQKAKERYFSSCSEWENQLMLLYKEFGPVWEPVTGNKLYEKEQQIYKRVDETRLDYESYVENLNANVQELTLSHLPQALNNMQEVAEQMVSVVHTALKNFEMFQTSLIGQVEIDMSSACKEFFIVPEFCQKMIFDELDLDNLPLPPSFNFDEYSYKDEALEIQARKTQYRAMSLLSPSELATRGAMFLAAGHKGTGNKGNGPILPPVKFEGLNAHLVDVCVEYLQQPLALKEEGIFRVPGDSSTIRSLHADFMTVGQDPDKLKASVMEQMDPNNISGLLKLHLRENHLLSSKIIANVTEVLSSAPKDETPSPVLKELCSSCSSTELSLLSKIITLMSTISSEPWKLENKMTPRTLGIACGLSLFPQLNPGQATQLLEYLMKYSEELSACTCNDSTNV